MKRLCKFSGYLLVLLSLAGCATKTLWYDNLGRGRGQPEFNIDHGYCEMVAQNASMQQQMIANQQNDGGCSGTTRQCAGLGALQGLMIVSVQAGTMRSCLESRGWIGRDEQ